MRTEDDLAAMEAIDLTDDNYFAEMAAMMAGDDEAAAMEAMDYTSF